MQGRFDADRLYSEKAPGSSSGGWEVSLELVVDNTQVPVRSMKASNHVVCGFHEHEEVLEILRRDRHRLRFGTSRLWYSSWNRPHTGLLGALKRGPYFEVVRAMGMDHEKIGNLSMKAPKEILGRSGRCVGGEKFEAYGQVRTPLPQPAIEERDRVAPIPAGDLPACIRTYVVMPEPLFDRRMEELAEASNARMQV